MYKLTLTYEERRAIGDDLRDVLMSSYYRSTPSWDDEITITYEIPEHLAWSIRDGIKEENFELACFNDELKKKLLDFVDGIV